MRVSHGYALSSYPRFEDDHYPTIDDRCMQALQGTWILETPAIDVCHGKEPTPLLPATNGDLNDIFQHPQKWKTIITNPPYKRPLVDNLLDECHRHLDEGRVNMLCILMRTAFDHAKTRQHLFKSKHYAGQTKMLFRPIWIAGEVKAQPIHNYVWHVFRRGHNGEPVVRYWGPHEKK